jgi:hypothetical protein
MGLDSFAYRVAPSVNASLPPVDAVLPKEGVERFAYWRKHTDLHVWMWARYRLRGGKQTEFQEFNMATVEVTAEDLDRLDEALAMWEILGAADDFFHNTTEEQAEADQKFIKDARQHIAAGERVFYDSWW